MRLDVTSHAPCRLGANIDEFFGRGFPLSDADLFLSVLISVDPRPISYQKVPG